ncbi:MAG: hypothetical protein GWP05_01245, partial [Anaerolineaceae bacterium]|nr:hypothetical protein [Anaerolineaceae bacterium]
MTSRRKWDRGVYAGLALYCALLLCADTARAEDAAETSVAANKSPAATSPSTTDPLKTEAVGDSGDKPAAAPISKPDIPSSDVLKRRSSDIEKKLIGDDPSKTKSDDGFGWLSLVAPLVVVLLVIVLVFWAVRKYVPGMRRLTGSSVVRVLARTYLSPRQSVTLIKVGRRILVVGQTADRLSRLGEISDGEEVSELLGLCRSEGDQSIS